MTDQPGLGDNLKATSSSLDRLLKQFKKIDDTVTTLDRKLKNLGLGGSTGGFKLGGGEASFGGVVTKAGQALMSAGGPIQKAIGTGLVAAGGSMNMMPDVNATMNRMSQGYNFTVMNGFSGANNATRASMQRGTLAMMGNGLTAPGSDMQVANIMASSGISYSSDPNSTYMQNVRQTSNLAKYLNIDNGVAAQSMANVTSGATSSSLMSNLGIMTSDPMSGKMYSFKDIAAQFENRVIKPGGKLTAEGVMDSYHRGFLGVSLANSGFDDTQQQMILQSLMNRAKTGKGIDYGDNAQMDKLSADNPMLAQYRLNTSDTKQMQKAEGQYKSGVDAAVGGLEVLNNVAGDLAATFGALKSSVEVFSGHRAGAGALDIAKNIFQGLFPNNGGSGGTIGTAFGSGGMSAISGVGGNYSSSGGGGDKSTVVTGPSGASTGGGSNDTVIVGSGRTSTNAKSQASNKTFSCIKPVKGGNVVAYYGQKGDRWDGGTHKALDWGVGEGTPVVAAHDGIVHTDTSKKQLGNYIQLWWTGAGSDRTFKTGYAHLKQFVANDGQPVKQGDIIAYSGQTGTNCDGPHLHFEVWRGSERVDPNLYITGSAPSAPKAPAKGSTNATTGGDAGSSSSAKAQLPISYTAQQQVAFSKGRVSGSGKVDYYGGGGGGTSSTIAVDPLSGAGYSPTSTATNYLAVTSQSSGTNHPLLSGGSGGGSSSNVVINLTIGRATDTEAKQFAEKVKGYLEEDRLISNMGRS